ncbi:DoxX family protein [Marinoscillum sp. MHG1-6]|uniref:DoxX family protein n=1 Tax=Marinoscillum sp. MHG1-6 TaxID=2959627 RepID=UPI0021584FA0|nr:DoxX family protein [Marinoscillum sp. MHG1-6]
MNLSKLLTPQVDSNKLNYSALVLRIGFGFLMMNHGFGKITHFNDYAPNFMNFLGLGGEISLALAIFAEFFCATFVAFGLFTRLSVIPLIFTMLVACFVAHAGDPIGKKEMSILYFCAYSSLFLMGPGKFSLDAVIFSKRNS